MSNTWIVVNTPRNWEFEIPGVEVLSARDYLTREDLGAARGVRVFNLCRSYRYMSAGYYVSLLAEARDHRPMPSVNTLQDIRTPAVVRQVSEDLDALIQRSLRPIKSKHFELSIYFGQNLAKRYTPLALALFNMFPAPMLRAHFRRGRYWELQSISTLASREVPASHRPFVAEAAQAYFGRRIRRTRTRRNYRYDLAILHDPEEIAAPSDPRALRRFERAAERLGLRPTFIHKDDYASLAEFDGLFIRETTSVNHHTYRFASRAAAAGLVVIDDPVSIVRCTNKVYLAELLTRHGVPIPHTVILHRDNLETVAHEIDYPCILKLPDSSFSQGVEKVEDDVELMRTAQRMLETSDLIVLQEFVPTAFDWRIGVLAGQPLYACRYHMVKKHWQIIEWKGTKSRSGASDTLPISEVPVRVLRTAIRACKLIGDGLYGVDLKEIARRVVVVEVNDNPSIDAGVEDLVLGDLLYERVMEHFLERIARRHQNGNSR
jgi:glutathione synthase/RimK-type ligase-like ATP-grasp enzyme